jgi:hypothetical protein
MKNRLNNQVSISIVTLSLFERAPLHELSRFGGEKVIAWREAVKTRTTNAGER